MKGVQTPVHISLTNQEAETFLNTKLPANNTHSKKSTGQTIFDAINSKANQFNSNNPDKSVEPQFYLPLNSEDIQKRKKFKSLVNYTLETKKYGIHGTRSLSKLLPGLNSEHHSVRNLTGNSGQIIKQGTFAFHLSKDTDIDNSIQGALEYIEIGVSKPNDQKIALNHIYKESALVLISGKVLDERIYKKIPSGNKKNNTQYIIFSRFYIRP